MAIHFILIYFYEKYTEVYSGSSQSSKMERFAKIVNYLKTMYCMSEWVLITPLKCMTLFNFILSLHSVLSKMVEPPQSTPCETQISLISQIPSIGSVKQFFQL